MKTEYKASLLKRLKSFIYAYNGIIFLFKTQGNVVIHSIVTILVLVCAIVFKLNVTEWCFVIFAIGFVFVMETFNTAIEQFIDFISPSYNVSAGRAKDLAAGAVLLAAIIAVIIGLIIFIPKIIDFFS